MQRADAGKRMTLSVPGESRKRFLLEDQRNDNQQTLDAFVEATISSVENPRVRSREALTRNYHHLAVIRHLLATEDLSGRFGVDTSGLARCETRVSDFLAGQVVGMRVAVDPEGALEALKGRCEALSGRMRANSDEQRAHPPGSERRRVLRGEHAGFKKDIQAIKKELEVVERLLGRQEALRTEHFNVLSIDLERVLDPRINEYGISVPEEGEPPVIDLDEE